MNRISKTTLGDLVEFQRGFDLPKSQFIDGNVPVISSNGVLGYHNLSKVKAPGITIGRSGTVGLPHFINEDFFPHNTALFIKDFKGNYPRYIFYLIKTLGLNDYKSGSGVPTMNRNHLHPIKVRAFLDFTDQQKIAKVLSDLDNKIELNNKINAELEAMAKTLYDYWFVQFDFPYSPPSEGCPQDGVGIGKPYKSSGGKMVWNEELKREIPERWEVKTLLDIANFVNGLACQKFRPKENEDSYRVIKIREMGTGFTENSEFVSVNIPKKVIVFNGDILFSWSATLDVKLWTGGTGGLNQHIFKVTSKNYPKSYYYFELLNYLKHFKMMAELRKTTMGHITQDHLRESRIAIPPKELINQLDKILNPILEKKVKLEVENQELASLRDWLLPMLMNGQVTVGAVEEQLGMVAESGEKYE
jgi:type I restriction enzyme S subunit